MRSPESGGFTKDELISDLWNEVNGIKGEEKHLDLLPDKSVDLNTRKETAVKRQEFLDGVLFAFEGFMELEGIVDAVALEAFKSVVKLKLNTGVGPSQLQQLFDVVQAGNRESFSQMLNSMYQNLKSEFERMMPQFRKYQGKSPSEKEMMYEHDHHSKTAERHGMELDADTRRLLGHTSSKIHEQIDPHMRKLYPGPRRNEGGIRG